MFDCGFFCYKCGWVVVCCLVFEVCVYVAFGGLVVVCGYCVL